MTTSNQISPPPPFQGFRSGFLKRSAIATLATLGLVAMTVAVYGQPAWAGYFLLAGLWSLFFLGLTPFILKAMVFERRPIEGLALIAVKILWLAVMFGLLVWLSRREPNRTKLGTALIAGISTPLAVIVLRVLGAMMHPGARNGSGRSLSATPDAESKS